ncbi:MAG TPA: Ig domain-containing protein [Nannocystaceae bacterium]|nr:Ig domain-containing protein [Nannocystaceae bacterium]
MVSGSIVALVLAVSARWAYEDAYLGLEDGAWYEGQDNEEALLAWGESYVMSSLAAMYRVTNHPMYLDRLAEHVDALLLQRDDARGVADYRGVSGACWRNISYQPPTPYCYAVHTGMLVTPMLEFVVAVETSPWAEQPSYDGETFAAKAERYLVAAQESVAFHEFEWDPDGHYTFPNVPNLPAAGAVQPLNQSNALGRAHILLAALTDDADQLAKATALATRFRAQITTGSDGAFLWNYAGGTYASTGEDISHAAINVDFAVMAAQHGIVFDDDDVLAFVRTFTSRVYVNDATFADHVGGGSTNDSSYRAQIGRWASLAPWSPTVYAAVRDAYDRDYPAAGIGSGSLLLGWGLLAEHEPKLCAPFFYVADWDDQGDVREATAFGANILTVPHALDTSCLVPVDHDAPRATEVGQWDGAAYHRVASWAASTGFGIKHVPYDPTWPFVYTDDGVLFQFEDSFVAGDGIAVHEAVELVPPTIDSSPPTAAPLDVAFDYVPTASGDEPRWWSLMDGPVLARIDPATGAIAWTPTEPGTYAFVVRLDNRVGTVEQSFEVEVGGNGGVDSSSSASATDGAGDSTSADPDDDEGGDPSGSEGGGSSDASDSSGARGDDAGCGCRSSPPRGAILVLLVLAGTLRRRQGLRTRPLTRPSSTASLTRP